MLVSLGDDSGQCCLLEIVTSREDTQKTFQCLYKNREMRLLRRLLSKLLTDDSVDLRTGGVSLATTYPFDVDKNVELKLLLRGKRKKQSLAMRVLNH